MPGPEFERCLASTTIVRRLRWMVVVDPDKQFLLKQAGPHRYWYLPSIDWVESESQQEIADHLTHLTKLAVIPQRRIGYFLDQVIGTYVEVLSFSTEVRYVSRELNPLVRWWPNRDLERLQSLIHPDSLFWLASALRHEVADIEAIRPRKGILR